MRDADRPAANRMAPDASRIPAQYALSGVLLLRACVNATITVWLLTHGPSWSDVFRAGSTYALVDGVLGLTAAWLLERRQPVGAPPLLVAMVFADAVLRLVVGLAVRNYPGLTEIPLTIVLLFGALGMWAAAAGAIAIVAWLVGHEHRTRMPKRTRVHAVFDPLTVAGVVALGLAVYALVVGPPHDARMLRSTGAVVTGTLTIVFLAALVLEARSVAMTGSVPLPAASA